MSGLVAAGADINAARQDGATPLFIASHGDINGGHFNAVLALLVGGSRALSFGQLARIRYRYPTVHAVLDTPPPIAPAVAAQLRLAWSKLCHDRLSSECLLEFVSVDVASRVGHFVGIAVYRLLLRQTQLIHEFRANTMVDNDDVAQVCLVDANWDVVVATRRFLSGVSEGVPPEGGK